MKAEASIRMSWFILMANLCRPSPPERISMFICPAA
jgi:hypothetical protein